MDFRHVRAFIAVADALSVTKAAERLHISQPPLSRHIHQLEEELGTTLFVRHHHGVTLTESGRLLLEKARVLEAAATDFHETAQRAARGDLGTLRVGIGWGLSGTCPGTALVQLGGGHIIALTTIAGILLGNWLYASLRPERFGLPRDGCS